MRRARREPQSDRLAARRGEPDDDQPLALEQGADAELHDGMVLYREYAQDRSALVPHLGPAQQRERVRGALGERGLIRLVGWIVPRETDPGRAGDVGATALLARAQGRRSAFGVVVRGVDREHLAGRVPDRHSVVTERLRRGPRRAVRVA